MEAGLKNQNPLLKLIKPLPEVHWQRRNTALLIVDMQYLDAHKDFGIFLSARRKGAEKALDYYRDRLKIIVPNIARLQRAFRQKRMEILQTKIESLTLDGRERSRGHKAKGIFASKGSKDGEILAELKPRENEIVLPKTASGVFNATAIDQILRNLGIENLIVTGVVTNNCVENAVRDACDRGYAVVLVEDGCAAVTEELHGAAVRAMKDHFAKVKSTAEVIRRLNRIR
jgi:nicotinamidase-related amidase